MSGPSPPSQAEPQDAITSTTSTPLSPPAVGEAGTPPLENTTEPSCAEEGAAGTAGEGEAVPTPLDTQNHQDVPVSHGDVQVFSAPEGTTPAAAVAASEPDASFFEPTLADVQMMHAGISSRSAALNNAPLLTSKHRDAERAARDAKKATRWPNTTIRIKFSDGTQIQSVFPSTSPIQPVYAFVRESLAPSAAAAPFTLYQPPRTTFPEHPVPTAAGSGGAKHPNPAMRSRVITPANYGPVRGAPATGLQGGTGGKESLSELGLVPQSVLVVKWADVEMNRSDVPAPLRDDLRAKAAPLPPPQPKEGAADDADAAARKDAIKRGATGDKKMPKWLQKGLLKKKT